MKNKVSCIIPAYNEESRIANVLKVVENHPILDEVIVINDGSTDKTADVIRRFKVTFIDKKKNQGKSIAVMTGIQKSKGDIIIMLDSDLSGLTKKNVTDLVNPVLKNEADMTLSLRGNSLLIYKLFGNDFISGERAFRRDFIKNYSVLKKLPGYGIESFYNEQAIKKKYRIKIVDFSNVILANKSDKIGFWKGNLGEIKMVMQIFKMIGFFRFFYIFFKMNSMRV